MLIEVLMAGADPAAHAQFDGLVAVLKAFPSSNGGPLMAWEVDGSGNACIPPVAGDSAMLDSVQTRPCQPSETRCCRQALHDCNVGRGAD